MTVAGLPSPRRLQQVAMGFGVAVRGGGTASGDGFACLRVRAPSGSPSVCSPRCSALLSAWRPCCRGPRGEAAVRPARGGWHAAVSSRISPRLAEAGNHTGVLAAHQGLPSNGRRIKALASRDFGHRATSERGHLCRASRCKKTIIDEYATHHGDTGSPGCRSQC
jgi:hypothetical protein